MQSVRAGEFIKFPDTREQPSRLWFSYTTEAWVNHIRVINLILERTSVLEIGTLTIYLFSRLC